MSKYTYDYPSDWLNEKLDRWDATDLRSALLSIMTVLSEDDIQDIFQAEMDRDGYFEEVEDA